MKEAAEAGNLRAMSLLNGMYLLGRGVCENGKEAERWLRQAVDGGFTDAASVLGMAYATGKAGVKRNIRLAREMLSRAAAEGEEQSRQMLEMIEKRQGMFRNVE